MGQEYTDFTQRFVFDNIDARGCFVRLEQTVEDIQDTHHYPANLAVLLNKFALAAVLLRDSIKIQGSVTIQLRTPGAIKLMMADCMADKRVRAISEYDTELLASSSDAIDMTELGVGAVLAITITPDGSERYQSIVPIENSSLEGCLEDYFSRSEQLPTLFSLDANRAMAVGIAVHALPQELSKTVEQTEENFELLRLLLNTLSTEEALSLDSQQTLTRLFHDQTCRVFGATEVTFGCVCSAEKSLEAIRSLGEEDVKDLIREERYKGKDELVVDCHFCFQRFAFPLDELAGLFR